MVKSKDAKTLLKKIDKHRDLAFHAKCETLLKSKEKERIKGSIHAANTKYAERHKEHIEVTLKVFRTAHECARYHLSFKEHTRMIELQSLNGIKCGTELYPYHACSNIIEHVASSMIDEIFHYIISNKAKFSVMIDESTSVSNVQSLIVYVRFHYRDESCTYYVGWLSVSVATSSAIKTLLDDFLHKHELDGIILREQFIRFCCDGASTMMGQINGVSALLKSKYPLVKAFHCIAHRLQLAVKNAVDTVYVVLHYKSFVDYRAV